MKNKIDQLMWDDLNEEIIICKKCHARMKLRKDSFSHWDCPNPKCKEVYIE